MLLSVCLFVCLAKLPSYRLIMIGADKVIAPTSGHSCTRIDLLLFSCSVDAIKRVWTGLDGFERVQLGSDGQVLDTFRQHWTGLDRFRQHWTGLDGFLSIGGFRWV